MEYIIKNGNKTNYYICVENVEFNDSLSKHNDIDVTEKSELIKNLNLTRNSNLINEFNASLKENSVGVHIRRGDFCDIGWNDNIEYYKASIGYFISKVESPQFYFFQMI